MNGLLKSRKAWASAIGAVSAVALQMIGFWAQMKGWDAQTLANWQFVVNACSVAVFTAGLGVATLWAGESASRTWGVTEIGAEELRMKAAVVEELTARLSPEARALLVQLSQQKGPIKPQVD